MAGLADWVIQAWGLGVLGLLLHIGIKLDAIVKKMNNDP